MRHAIRLCRQHIGIIHPPETAKLFQSMINRSTIGGGCHKIAHTIFVFMCSSMCNTRLEYSNSCEQGLRANTWVYQNKTSGVFGICKLSIFFVALSIHSVGRHSHAHRKHTQFFLCICSHLNYQWRDYELNVLLFIEQGQEGKLSKKMKMKSQIEQCF